MNHSDSEDSICSGKSSRKNSLPAFAARCSRFKNVGGSLEKPAELFRKDLISAMKLPDNECLFLDDYMLISDHWKQDWEKGVQVPVNPEMELTCQVNVIEENEWLYGSYGFKMPKKLLHAMADEQYKQSMHELHETHAMAEEVSRYDLDHLDEVWLNKYNEIREKCGQEELSGWLMENIMEELEARCFTSLKTAEAANMEYDEDTVCDVCRMPDVEEGNEMVFCDGCDVGVHQACYGILKIPKGSWVCRTCAVGLKPRCELCTTAGGAMKSTKTGNKWAHISCAIWIPEVTIEDAEKMEPICNIDLVPATRWNLICCVCKERSGVCIKCSDKRCKNAFHVTCAFKKNFKMKMSCEEAELRFRACCNDHSNESSPKKGVPDLMTEEQKKAEKSRLQSLRETFYTLVDYVEVADDMELDTETVSFVYEYWKLKRKCNFDKPLLTPKLEESAVLVKQEEDSLVARLKMFIHLRQDLERVRNLCYMVSRRERTKNQHLNCKNVLFTKQADALEKFELGSKEFESLRQINKRTSSIYDDHEALIKMALAYESISSIKAKDEDDDDDDDYNYDGNDFKQTSFLKEFLSSNASNTTTTTPLKTPKMKVKVNIDAPSTSSKSHAPSASKYKKRPPSSEPRENPYAKPTYKNFAWLLSSRKKRKLDDDYKGDTEKSCHKLDASVSDHVCNSSMRRNGSNVIATRSVGQLSFQSEVKDGQVTLPIETADLGTNLKESVEPQISAEKSPSSVEMISPASNVKQNSSNGKHSPENEFSRECFETPPVRKYQKKIKSTITPIPSITPKNKRGRPRKSVLLVSKKKLNKEVEEYQFDDLEKFAFANQDPPLPNSLKPMIVNKSDVLSPPHSSSSPDDILTNHLRVPFDDLADNHAEESPEPPKTDDTKIEDTKIENVRHTSPDVLCSDSDDVLHQSSPSVEVPPRVPSPPPKPVKRKYTKRTDRPSSSSPINGRKILNKIKKSKIPSKKSFTKDGSFKSPQKHSQPLNDSGSNLIQSTITSSPLFNKSPPLKSPVHDEVLKSSEKLRDNKPRQIKRLADNFDDDDDDDFVNPPKISPSSQENGIAGKKYTKLSRKFLNMKNSIPAPKSFQSTLDKYLKSKDDTELKDSSLGHKSSQASGGLSIKNPERSVEEIPMKKAVLKLDRICSFKKDLPQKTLFPLPMDKKTLKNTSNLPARRTTSDPDEGEEARTKYPRRKSVNVRS